jgi:hypothetical protein
VNRRKPQRNPFKLPFFGLFVSLSLLSLFLIISRRAIVLLLMLLLVLYLAGFDIAKTRLGSHGGATILPLMR